MADAVDPAPGDVPGRQPKRFARQTHALNPPLRRIFHQEVKDDWMEVEVKMAIEMIHGQSGGVEAVDLSKDLFLELSAQASSTEVAQAGGDGI